jgi:hypothetical protein
MLGTLCRDQPEQQWQPTSGSRGAREYLFCLWPARLLSFNACRCQIFDTACRLALVTKLHIVQSHLEDRARGLTDGQINQLNLFFATRKQSPYSTRSNSIDVH